MERKRWIECIKKWIACGSATPTTMKAKAPSNLACFVFMCTLHSTQKLTLAQNWLRCIGCEYQLSSITKYIHMSDDFWLFFCAAQQQQWQQPKKTCMASLVKCEIEEEYRKLKLKTFCLGGEHRCTSFLICRMLHVFLTHPHRIFIHIWSARESIWMEALF